MTPPSTQNLKGLDWWESSSESKMIHFFQNNMENTLNAINQSKQNQYAVKNRRINQHQ